MKIVASYKDDDTLIGLAATMQAMHLDFTFWDKNRKPTFDMFDELHPNVFLCDASYIDESIVRALQEYPDTQLVLFGMGVPSDLKPALVCYPHQLTKEQVGMINRGGFKCTQVFPAADLARFGGGKDTGDETEVLFLSDIQYNEKAFSILYRMMPEFNMKVIGPVPINAPEFVGGTHISTRNNMIKSTKMGIDFENKHIYNYAINKVFCLSTKENGIWPVTTVETCVDDARKYLGAPMLRKKHIRNAYSEVANNHTYFHRIADMFEILGHTSVAELAHKTLGEILND